MELEGETVRGTRPPAGQERFVSTQYRKPLPPLDLAKERVADIAGAVAGEPPFRDGAASRAIESELREDAGRFRRFFDAVTDGVMLVGRSGCIETANCSLATMHRYGSPEDLVGTSASALVAPSCRDYAVQIMARRLSGEDIATIEHELLRSDGTTFYAEISATLLRGPDGAVSSFICTTHETTSRRRAETALRESEQRYRDLFDGAIEGIYQVTLDGRFLAANRALARMLGYGSAAAMIAELGGSASSIWPDLDVRSRWAAELQAHEGIVRGYECQFVRRDGQRLWVSLTGRAVHDPDGGNAYYEGFVEDITEHKRAEDLAKQDEERYKLMFESAPLAINVTRGTDVIYANSAHLEMFGMSSLKELQDLPPLGQFAPERRAQLLENIKLRAEGKPVPVRYESECLRSDGTRFPVLLQFARTNFADGPATVGFITDITERKRAEEALSENDLQFREFVEQAPVAITVIRDGICLYANQRLAKMLGRGNPNDLVGGPTHQHFAPHMQERVKELARLRSLGLPAPAEYEADLQRADGSVLPVHVAVGRVHLRDGPAFIAFVTDITDRRRAEKTMRENKAMRDVTERVAKVGSWRHDLATYRSSWSDEMFALFDIEPAALDGDPNSIENAESMVESHIHPDDLGTVVSAHARAVETGEPVTVEFRLLGKDGAERIIHGGGISERDEAGKPVAMIGYFQDVTDRRNTTARLEAAAAEWSETFDAMGDSVALLGLDGLVVRCNAATTALTGLDMTGIVGRHCCEVFHAPDGTDCPHRRSVETGQSQTSVIEKGGRCLRISCRPQIDTAGRARGSVHVVTDITKLRKAEQAARERSHFLEELLEAIPVPVYYKDATLHFVGHNEAYATSIGRSKDQIVGKNVFDVRPAEQAKNFQAADRELLARPTHPLKEEVVLPGPDGEPRYLLSHRAVFSDVAGKPAGIVGVNLDVTDIRRAEQQLASATVRLQLTLKGTVAALCATTEMRDPYTAGHQRRVAKLACAIALQLGRDAALVELLRTAALLHDIGKIVVPAEILSKPGRLTEPEMQLIRQHAAAGAEIVGPIGFAPDVAEMIRQHHERLDGTGYPSALRGSTILPEARILAVADVVEAMVSHRPYRPARAIEAAVAELEDGAGSRYDGDVCEAAISLVREQGFTFGRSTPFPQGPEDED
jgi:PAS domain S-box-containing protein/putative nucleotidyltransferase with HDIG domain